MSARAYIVAMFPQGPRPFAHPSGNLEEALMLVHSYQISSVGSFPFLSALLFSAVSLVFYWRGFITCGQLPERLICLHLSFFLGSLLWHDELFH